MMFDAGVTVSNMAPSILLSTLVSMVLTPVAGALAGAGTTAGTIGAKVVGAIPKIVSAGSIGLSARGNAYAEMINQGYGKEQAEAYANLVSASETGLSLLLSGISKVGGISPRIAKAVEEIDNAFLRITFQYGGAFGGEFMEEGTQTLLEPLFKEIALGYDTGEKISWEEVFYNALLGGLMGGFFESPEIIKSNGVLYLQDRITKKKVELNQSTEAFLSEIKASGKKNSQSEKVTENINEATGQGEGTGKMTFGDYYTRIVRNPYDAKASSRVRNMTATERIFARAGANAEDISVAVSRTTGLQYDGEKEVEAYEYGLEQRKKGNGQDLDLLIEATDY
ncbi:MAG: hypothetical protein IJD97_05220, partial [Clostridia bacterium]|nr:hypothetical protein [Clostridia bacterium]